MTPTLLVSLDRVARALYSGVFNCLSFRLLGFLKLNVDVCESGSQVGTESLFCSEHSRGMFIVPWFSPPHNTPGARQFPDLWNSSHDPQGFLIFPVPAMHFAPAHCLRFHPKFPSHIGWPHLSGMFHSSPLGAHFESLISSPADSSQGAADTVGLCHKVCFTCIGQVSP